MSTSRIEEMVGEFESIFSKDGLLHDVNGALESREVIDWLRQALTQAHQAGMDEAVGENTSDGYHTFKELYEFRLLYNAHLFNEWAKQGMYDVHKSTKHGDGEDCFGGGWFIVVATLPGGDISNHYEMNDWGLFQCEVRETAKEWDGHTSQDVATRLHQALDDTIKALQDNK